MTMGKPQIITSPSGEELIVVPRRDYEDLVDAAGGTQGRGGPRRRSRGIAQHRGNRRAGKPPLIM
jgi:hypothetical protein